MATSVNGHQNGLYTYDSFSGNKKNKESHFLWWCAGAHQKLLKDFPSEHTRYAGLGGVILATFVLASLSAGYAIYSVFDNILWAILFAVIWGLIIFNFDRFLVSTMRKYGVSKGKQFMMAVPRIALALLISITIARPLELKLFAATQERNRLTDRKLSIEDSLHGLQEAYIREADGTGGSMQRGIERLTRLKQDAFNAAMNQFSPELKQ